MGAEMSLSNLIRKREPEKPASATLATSATFTHSPTVNNGKVARVATVAVAKSGTDLPEDDTRHFRWLVHFSDRDPVEVYCSPDATHAEILECYPDALAAEPIPERIKRVFTETEDAEWEALWLDTLDWPTPEYVSTDDRRRCTQCRRLNPLGRCIAAQEIAATQTYEPIRDILRRCEGYIPRADDPDTRPGRERWPQLIQNRGISHD